MRAPARCSHDRRRPRVSRQTGAQAAAQDAVGISPGRLGAFSDGILAIAATILTLDVRTPASGAPVWSSLQAEWPALAAYASTFLGICVVWIHTTTCLTKCQSTGRW